MGELDNKKDTLSCLAKKETFRFFAYLPISTRRLFQRFFIRLDEWTFQVQLVY